MWCVLACIVVVCKFFEIVHCYECLAGIYVGCVYELCRCEQWRILIGSPRRACLAQARRAEARLELPARVVAQATRVCFWASKQLAQARGVSPKRDPALLSCSCLSPRLGGGGLTWARPLSLSEVLGETALCLDVCLVLNDLFWLGMNVMMRDMYIMECDAYVTWFMNYKWWIWYEYWHVN